MVSKIYCMLEFVHYTTIESLLSRSYRVCVYVYGFAAACITATGLQLPGSCCGMCVCVCMGKQFACFFLLKVVQAQLLYYYPDFTFSKLIRYYKDFKFYLVCLEDFQHRKGQELLHEQQNICFIKYVLYNKISLC